MAKPNRAFMRLLELVQNSKAREDDPNMLATFCIELDRTVVGPLQERVEALERKLALMEKRLSERASK